MRGRPRKEIVLGSVVGVRLNHMDEDRLERLCTELDKDRCEVLRQALRYYYFAMMGGRN